MCRVKVISLSYATAKVQKFPKSFYQLYCVSPMCEVCVKKVEECKLVLWLAFSTQIFKVQLLLNSDIYRCQIRTVQHDLLGPYHTDLALNSSANACVTNFSSLSGFVKDTCLNVNYINLWLNYYILVYKTLRQYSHA